MPVSGTVTKIPNVGDLSQFLPDSVERWPGDGSDSYNIKKAVAPTTIEFKTRVFLDDCQRLINDMKDHKESINHFRQSFGTPLSYVASQDPFRIDDLSDATQRIKSANELLTSLLWDDKFLNLAFEIPDEDYPALEARISVILSDTALSLCASLINLKPEDIRRMASEVIADQIREKAGAIGPYNREDVEFTHPAAAFQTLRINDPVLYLAQKIQSSVEDFDNYFDRYTTLSESYWTRLAEKKIYNAKDILTMQTWIPEPPSPFIAKKRLSPLEKLERGREEWRNTRRKIEETKRIVEKIGFVGLNYWIGGFPVEIDNKDYSAFVARQAADELKLSDPDLDTDAAVIAHAITWDRVQQLLLDFFYLDSEDNREIDLTKIDTSAMRTLASSFIPHISTYIISTQMVFKMPSIFGGTSFSLAKMDFSSVGSDQEPGRSNSSIFDDLNYCLVIESKILRDPGTLDEQVNNLRDWRTNIEKAASRILSVGGTGKSLSKIRAKIEKTFMFADNVRTVLSNVEKVNQITKILKTIMSRLNSDRYDEGNIEVPPDYRVCGVFSKIGEYLTEGQPVASIRERFRCKARLFTRWEDVSAMALQEMAVWKIAINEVSEPTAGVSLVCIIRRIEPTDPEVCTIDLDIFAAVQIKIDGVSNLPTILPLSSRYMGLGNPAITFEMLSTAESALSTEAPRSIKFLEKVH